MTRNVFFSFLFLSTIIEKETFHIEQTNENNAFFFRSHSFFTYVKP
jgi:hypothetical protein